MFFKFWVFYHRFKFKYPVDKNKNNKKTQVRNITIMK